MNWKKLLNSKVTLTLPVMMVGLALVMLVSLSGYGYAYVQHNAMMEAFENKEENNSTHSADETMSFEEFLKAQPNGIPRGQVPPGEEDLYIKKSEIVPPVCPKCPDVSVCEKATKCPPCPPCARCPEPAFECKKVPNYSRSAGDNDMLPMPVLSDFSQFGM